MNLYEFYSKLPLAPLVLCRGPVIHRRFESQQLRRRFDQAWRCLPKVVKLRLRFFIRQVREVRTLRGIYIRCPDQSWYGPLQDGSGFTFYYVDDVREFCDILLPRHLAGLRSSHALGIILHELAHADDCCQNHRKIVRRKEILSERRAWIQAVVWAKHADLKSDLQQQIAPYAIYAILVDKLEDMAQRARQTMSAS